MYKCDGVKKACIFSENVHVDLLLGFKSFKREDKEASSKSKSSDEVFLGV
jgi:hypothetical protein